MGCRNLVLLGIFRMDFVSSAKLGANKFLRASMPAEFAGKLRCVHGDDALVWISDPCHSPHFHDCYIPQNSRAVGKPKSRLESTNQHALNSFLKVTPPCPCPTAASAAPPVTTAASWCFGASRWPTTLRMEPQSMGTAEYAGATNAATPVTRRAPNQQLNPYRSSLTLSTRPLPPLAIGPSDGSHDYWGKARALCGGAG